MSITKLSYELAGYFGKQLDLEDERTDILRYGFEVILGESLKIIALVLVAHFLGLFPYVLVSLLTLGSYRLFSGGYHAKTYERCFVWSMVLFLGMGKLVQLLLPYFRLSAPVLFIVLLATFILSLWVAFKWAPAETPNKLLSLTEKSRQKKISLAWVTLWFIFMIFILLFLPYEKIGFIILGSFMAHIVQTFTVTPAGFKVMESVDTLADKITRKL